MSEDNSQDQDSVEIMESPIVLTYNFSAGRATSNFLREMKKGNLYGQRSSKPGKVIIPPRGSDPETGTATHEEVELSNKGTVISFTIVHIPIPNNPIQPPYIIANIVLDGADQTFIHLVSECENDQIQQGTRLEAVWKDESEWDYTFENIKYFRPIDEPIVDIDELKAKRLAEAEAWVKANGGQS